jgi:cytochrome d ubiquinol oxidase subunit II
MVLQSLPLVFVLIGLTLYTILGGADFGAGFWQLFAGRGERGARVREFAHQSMGPVWEANHVWLIFVLTVLWTSYPEAFASIASTLAVPLFVALLGIMFRGAAYAIRSGARSDRERGGIDTIFSISSILTPFALGAAIGGIATNRVPVGNAVGHLFTSWLNGTSIFLGVLAVSSCAYLAAVYLAADAARDGRPRLERDFRARALVAGTITGALAIAGVFILKGDRHALLHSLLAGRALAGVLTSFSAGLATLVLVYGRRYRPARYCGAVAVAAIVAGWALARWPTILAGLTVREAAAGHNTLVWVVVCVLVGAVILVPSLGLLFRLELSGRFAASQRPAARPSDKRIVAVMPGALARASSAFLIAGFALLSLADAGWAHAVGIVFLFVFVLLAFPAIIGAALDDPAPTNATETPGQP